MSSDDRLLAGRYALHAPIGRGGMGEVWRATDTVLDREVAVKTIDLRRVPDESGPARFEREARVTAGISHPNVVTVHDAGVEDETAYLVMELLPGRSLADRLRSGPLPVDEVVDVGEQVASALEAAHTRGLVHRDVKPGNIVEDGEGRVRVLDFGITQLGEAGGDQALTATHTVMGTAEYLAPEQASGGRVDGRADLYALGCVLFSLLAGDPPYSGPTAVTTMMMHTHDPVPDVRTLRPDTPAWLAELVAGLMAKDPEGRPARAADVAEALRARRAPTPVGATSVLPRAGAATTQRLAPVPAPLPAESVPPPPPVPGDDGGRRRGGAGRVLGVLLALVLVGALAWWLVGRDGASTSTDGSSAAPSAAASSPAPSSSQDQPTTDAPEPSTSAPEPSTSAPSEVPSAEPTTDTQAAVAAAAQTLFEGVKLLERSNGLDKDSAKRLDQAQRDFDRSLREGDAQGLTESRDTLVEEYRSAVLDGAVGPTAAAVLDPLVQAFSDAVDQYAAG
ncbi:serine/threonine-protein kinase [Arthrobacter sp. NEB 688]|uniref:serine/threonine-protein kinase n=1 Tax=Arthrobacter sp. NEB 688 TaxID=904039 RepID=UPI001564119B|nr:serine/threonine-protein kinase [Arthrobacter sp. NEB 688]QKE84800.1 serine/threonine protein kinase [Arthrobacter sp. NEB 688]